MRVWLSPAEDSLRHLKKEKCPKEGNVDRAMFEKEMAKLLKKGDIDQGQHDSVLALFLIAIGEVTYQPTSSPTSAPTNGPSTSPSNQPSTSPSNKPTSGPTSQPTNGPTSQPTNGPTSGPTLSPVTSAPTSALFFQCNQLRLDDPGKVALDDSTFKTAVKKYLAGGDGKAEVKTLYGNEIK